MTREELETICEDIFERLPRPINDALKMAEMSIDQVDTIILIGGGVRMPKVQEKLAQALNG